MTTTPDTETILDARYHLERRIGVGGMATVYRAWDDMLHRHVAVKLLHASRAADPTFVERFKREACATANLAHPTIVQVYSWGASDDTYYIVMEYVDGPNLKQVIRERGPLPEAEVLAIGAEIAAALDVAHARGIVHRDITPHNVMLSATGRVKVTDFGIAHAIGTPHFTTADTVLGTAHYLSPEQVLHQPVDGRADLYSLGAVLYELLTGEVPFHGDSLTAVALQHAYAEPPAPRTLRPAVSPATDAIVGTLLAKNPDDRYQTAADVRAALRDVGTHRTEERASTMALPLAVPPGVPVRPPSHNGWSGFRDRRWLLALPVVALLLLFLTTRGGFGASSGTFTDIRVAASTVTPAAAPTTPVSAATKVAPTQPLPSPTSVPAPTATPPPTATPISPTATAPPPAPKVIVQATKPQDAVLGFYMFVAAHQFDRATALWTPRLQGASPPAQAINARYAQIDHITVEHWEVTAQTADRATVAITVQEYNQGGAAPQRFQGTWQLVHDAAGWLLDAQEIVPA
jgi:serine/threonine protein kinase